MKRDRSIDFLKGILLGYLLISSVSRKRYTHPQI